MIESGWNDTILRGDFDLSGLRDSFERELIWCVVLKILLWLFVSEEIIECTAECGMGCDELFWVESIMVDESCYVIKCDLDWVDRVCKGK